MAKLVALYKKPADVAAFDAYYFSTHVPKAKTIPGLRSYEVSDGPVGSAQGESAYHLVAMLGFDSLAAIQAAFGSPEDLKPGELTKLDVQLKMEGLKGQAGKGEQLEDVEEASKQERSAMDYRNVPSQLSPAQKDALNQNRLPREQREIVKYYFEEIRPRATTSAPRPMGINRRHAR